MNIKKRWVVYCSGNTRDATEDDWNNFVLKIFLNWRQRQLELDPNAPKKSGKTLAEYADVHYSFTQFTEGADVYQELVDLEHKRHNP
ncbi:MAG: hypothetical protein WCG12_15265 [Alcaligenaceae bacterium]